MKDNLFDFIFNSNLNSFGINDKIETKKTSIGYKDGGSSITTCNSDIPMKYNLSVEHGRKKQCIDTGNGNLILDSNYVYLNIYNLF